MVPERRKQIAFVLLPIVVALILLIQGDAGPWAVGAVVVAGLLLVALLARRGRHTPWRSAAQRLGTGGAVVFWKPGCVYCERLLHDLRGDDRITWVNVWADRQANTEVRRLNNGDELTPTVLIGDQVLRNPSAAQLRARLTGAAEDDA
jgi:mycoredoxin